MTKPFLAPPAAARRAFTLVELLVVITIIAILATLVTIGAANVIWSARQTRIKLEVDALATALNNYKNQYGSYPPADLSFSTPGAVQGLRLHLSRAFPRFRQPPNNSAGNDQLKMMLYNAGADVSEYNPANALVFWLSGFNADPEDPFLPGGQSRTTPFFEFDKMRLKYWDGDVSKPTPFEDTNPPNGLHDPGEHANHATYHPSYGGQTPYVYIDFRNYHSVDAQNTPLPKWYPLDPNDPKIATQGVAGAYAVDNNNDGELNAGDDWANQESFQIISAGQDGQFGIPADPKFARLYPAGVNYDLPDEDAGADNVTNFCEKSNLEAAKP